MSFVLHLNIYIFPMILLAMIFMSISRNNIQTARNRIYRKLLFFTLLLLISELASWAIDGKIFSFCRIISWIINIFYFMLSPFVAMLWLNFISFCLYKRTLWSIKRRFLLFSLLFPVTIYYMLVLSSPMTNLIFNIDSNNLYQRGELYYLPYFVNAIYLLISLTHIFICMFDEKSLFRKKQYIFLCVSTVIPIIAALLQLAVKDLWVVYPCTALSELLIYIHLQKMDITTDALTGINNRGCFNIYLKNILAQKEKRKSLCLFVIDLDHFKYINDTFGHDVGDNALIKTASILSDFFYKSNAFVARYGGDEFCIICHCKNSFEIIDTIEHLNLAFEKENQSSNNIYNLSFSMGFARLDENNYMSANDIVRCADKMMYENKQAKKNNRQKS